MTSTLIQKFDELRKYIKTEEGRRLAKEFRKSLKRNQEYLEKLDTYFTDTMDGVEPTESATDLKLINK